MDETAPSSSHHQRKERGGLWQRLLALFGGGREQAACPQLEELLPAETLERNGQQLAEDGKSLQMLGRLIAFSGLTVEDVLVPRADIVAVPADMPLADLIEAFTEALHSRLPVYDETLDNVVGMVHIKDLLRHLKHHAKMRKADDAAASQPDLVVPGQILAVPVAASPLLRPVLYVPDSMPAADLLLKMQSTRIHMAIVIDEYGGTEGIATIEDVIEQIVGEISDEHDTDEDEQEVTPVPGGYIISARMELSELERLIGLDLLPEDLDEEVDTVGGLLFTRLGRVPTRGEIIRLDENIEFEVLDADPRRIKKLRLVLPREMREKAEAAGTDKRSRA